MLTPDFFEIFLDSDLREDNGPDGFEWAMHAEFPLNSALFMWNGSDYVRESTTLIFTAGQGEVTAMLNVRQLGSETVRFYFYADTLPVEADNFSDEAREAPQSYLVQALVPLLEDSFARPKAIRAGRRLAVDVGVWTDSDTSPLDLVPRAGREEDVVRQRFVEDRRHPVFTVPRTARGKPMTVTMVLKKRARRCARFPPRKCVSPFGPYPAPR